MLRKNALVVLFQISLQRRAHSTFVVDVLAYVFGLYRITCWSGVWTPAQGLLRRFSFCWMRGKKLKAVASPVCGVLSYNRLPLLLQLGSMIYVDASISVLSPKIFVTFRIRHVYACFPPLLSPQAYFPTERAKSHLMSSPAPPQKRGNHRECLSTIIHNFPLFRAPLLDRN